MACTNYYVSNLQFRLHGPLTASWYTRRLAGNPNRTSLPAGRVAGLVFVILGKGPPKIHAQTAIRAYYTDCEQPILDSVQVSTLAI